MSLIGITVIFPFAPSLLALPMPVQAALLHMGLML